jgi:hypothetical protein
VAVITLTSDTGNWSTPHPMTKADPEKWFGLDVPKGVTNITVMRSFEYDELIVRWRVVGDRTIHEMPFTITDEGVLAALAAMKLTC